MTRTQVWIGASIISLAVVSAFLIPFKATAQAEQPCADRSRQRVAINLARQINTLQIQSHLKTDMFLPMTALREVTVPSGFTTQLVVDAAGSQYVFSVKNVQDPCHFTVFSDQEQLIYIGQPLR
jgi:hypothetical protein